MYYLFYPDTLRYHLKLIESKKVKKMIREETTFENAVLKSCYAKLRNNLYKSRCYRSEKVDIAVCTRNYRSHKVYFHRLVNNIVLDTENRNLFTLTRSLNTIDTVAHCYYDGVAFF